MQSPRRMASCLPMKRLIVTGDDFGLAEPVNRAIEIGYREGILTTASLMVAGAAAADAVARAKRLPDLGVGLHLVVAEGSPVSPSDQIPNLVDSAGRFYDHLLHAALRFFFLPGSRRQLESEIRAQFEAFRATGLTLDHVNAHNHMHLHPTVLGLLMRVASDYGSPPIRVPQEAHGTSGRKRPSESLANLAIRPWLGLLRLRLRRAGFRSNDWVLGLHQTGSMDEDTVLRLLEHLPEGITEMYFHAATERCPEIDRCTPEYLHEAELRTLTSTRVRDAIREQAAIPIRFQDI